MNTKKEKSVKCETTQSKTSWESQTLVTVVLTEKSDTDDPGVTECRLETNSGSDVLVTTSTQRLAMDLHLHQIAK